MNLSNKVEETFGKIMPHHEQSASAPAPSGVEAEKSGFGVTLEDIRDYLIVIIGFGVAAAAVFFLILPQYKQISTISADYTESQTKLTQLEGQAKYLDQLVGLKSELENNIKIAGQALPPTEDKVPYLLDQIVQVSEKSGVAVDILSLNGISDPDSESTTGLRNVLIQLSVSGTHDNIQNFLYNLENARTITDVLTFSLTQKQDTRQPDPNNPDEEFTGEPEETVAFSLKSYLRPEDDGTTVDLNALAQSPSYDGLYSKLNMMTYYEPRPIDVTFGRDNPFEPSEATPSIEIAPTTEEITPTPVPTEETDGFQQ